MINELILDPSTKYVVPPFPAARHKDTSGRIALVAVIARPVNPIAVTCLTRLGVTVAVVIFDHFSARAITGTAFVGSFFGDPSVSIAVLAFNRAHIRHGCCVLVQLQLNLRSAMVLAKKNRDINNRSPVPLK